MKQATKLVMIFAVLAAFAMKTNAQESKPKVSASDWKELKAFHSVMAQTFHPSEEGNLQPIKERSGEMVEKAKALAASKVPDEFNKPEMLTAIKELVTGSEKLDAMIKAKVSDEEITKYLSGLHDVFHKIVGLCRPGDKHEEHDHSDPNHKH
jgi:hypothetical protein